MSQLDDIRARIKAVRQDPSIAADFLGKGSDDYWRAAADREWLEAELARATRRLRLLRFLVEFALPVIHTLLSHGDGTDVCSQKPCPMLREVITG